MQIQANLLNWAKASTQILPSSERMDEVCTYTQAFCVLSVCNPCRLFCVNPLPIFQEHQNMPDMRQYPAKSFLVEGEACRIIAHDCLKTIRGASASSYQWGKCKRVDKLSNSPEFFSREDIISRRSYGRE